MVEPKKRINRFLTWHTAWSVFFAVAASVAVYLLFSTQGLASRSAGVDLSFLLTPLIGYYGLRLVSRLCGKLIPPVRGTQLAHALNGLALSFASFLVLNQADNLSKVEELSRFGRLFEQLSEAAPSAPVIFTGLTLFGFSNTLEWDARWKKAAQPVCDAAALSLIGLGLWWFLSVFKVPALAGTGLIILGGFLAVALSRLGKYGETNKHPLISTGCTWLRQFPAAKFLAGSFATAYLIFIRPAIASTSPYAYIVDWALICLVCWRMLAIMRGRLRSQHSVIFQEADWQRHVQRIDDLTPDNFMNLVELQDDFVYQSHRDQLVDYLEQLLKDNRVGDPEADKILEPLLKQRDRKVPWYVSIIFPVGLYLERKNKKRNLKERRTALDKVINELNNVGHQQSPRNKGVSDERITVF